MSAVVLLPLVALLALLGFDFYCLRDLNRAGVVYHFTREVWTVLILIAGPFGGIAYLKLGRQR